MGRQRRGTEYEGIPNLVPGAISIPSKQPLGIAAAGTGSNVIPPVATPPSRQRQMFLLSQGNLRNAGVLLGGAGTRLFDLSTLNSELSPIAIQFPGADLDDNDSQWLWTLPANMAAVPNLKARLHVLVTDTGSIDEPVTTIIASDALANAGGQTILNGRTSDTGQLWVDKLSWGPDGSPPGGFLLPAASTYTVNGSGTSASRAYINATPPSADYYAEADVKCVDSTGAFGGGVGVRMVSGADTGYFGGFSRHDLPPLGVDIFGTPAWFIVKGVAGVYTALANATSPTPPGTGVTATVKLEVTGTGLELFANGVSVLTATDGTITAAGFGGIAGANSAPQPRFSNFTVAYTVTAPVGSQFACWELTFADRFSLQPLAGAAFGLVTNYLIDSGPSHADEVVILEQNVVDMTTIKAGDTAIVKLRRYGANLLDTLDDLNQVAIGLEISWDVAAAA